jgi:multiple sugar transport system permease protein
MKAAAHRSLWAYGLLSPALVLFTIFIGLPMVLAVVIAFKRIDLAAGIVGSPWVGLQNFNDLFGNILLKERVLRAFRNTFLFTLCFVPLNLLASLIIATLIHSLADRRQSFYRAAFYLPTVASAIVFAMIWKWMYDPNFGLLNLALGKFGIAPIQWTGDPKWAIWAVIIAALGAGPGGNVLIYLAALGSVPADTLEAARVDGAGALQRWWHVTLPLLRPVTLYLIVLNTIGSFQVFELVFILTSGGPAGSSTVLVYEIYDLAFGQGRYGTAGALSLMMLVIVTGFAALQFRIVRTDIEESRPPTVSDRVLETIGETVGLMLGWVGDRWERLCLFAKKHFFSSSAERRPPTGRLPRKPRFGGVFQLRELPSHLILFPLALLFLTPMVWMFLSAFTPRAFLLSSPPKIKIAYFNLSNYEFLLERAPLIFRWFWNSTYISLTTTVVQLLLSCLAGYVFAKMVFPGRKLLFSLLIASIMLPWQALVIPLFIVISSGIRNVLHIDLLDTHWAMILPALCSPVGIFLMRQYISGLPRDLEEAARIDGCGEFGIWWRVILPLCRPILGAWGILTFTGLWKSFFWPFVVLGSESLFTLEVGLQTLQQQNTTDYGLVMAGATVSAVPMIIIFFIFQKQIVRGLTFGAVKG